MALPSIFTLHEAAVWLQVSESTLKKTLQQHPLYFKVGRKRLFEDRDLHALDAILPAERLQGARLTLEEFCRKLAGEAVIKVKPRPLSVVYIVRCGEFVKIGTTGNFRSRLRSIRAATPHPISVLFTFAGGVPEERELHNRFAAHKHHYEWFRLEGALADYIASLKAGDG